jgi:hypothetical protein
VFRFPNLHPEPCTVSSATIPTVAADTVPAVALTAPAFRTFIVQAWGATVSGRLDIEPFTFPVLAIESSPRGRTYLIPWNSRPTPIEEIAGPMTEETVVVCIGPEAEDAGRLERARDRVVERLQKRLAGLADASPSPEPQPA